MKMLAMLYPPWVLVYFLRLLCHIRYIRRCANGSHWCYTQGGGAVLVVSPMYKDRAASLGLQSSLCYATLLLSLDKDESNTFSTPQFKAPSPGVGWSSKTDICGVRCVFTQYEKATRTYHPFFLWIVPWRVCCSSWHVCATGAATLIFRTFISIVEGFFFLSFFLFSGCRILSPQSFFSQQFKGIVLLFLDTHCFFWDRCLKHIFALIKSIAFYSMAALIIFF